MCTGSRPCPEMGKFSTARWVVARHLAWCGTRTSPIESWWMRWVPPSSVESAVIGQA